MGEIVYTSYVSILSTVATIMSQAKELEFQLPSTQTIFQWRQSFLSLNHYRLEQARSLLLERQSRVLDVLPLLMHLNHPQLPGFINHKVPSGIEHYVPQVNSVSALFNLAKGIEVPKASGDRCIQSIFLIGSLGTLAQTADSDLDVWLCYSDNLDNEQLNLLKEKCDLIEKWAEVQSVELHFFLMNATNFRQQKKQNNVDTENSGSAQHVLLLDEFYRSSLWLAGRHPSWWLIPTKYEERSEAFLEKLEDRQLIHSVHWINFDAIPTIPATEFIGAGIWQLNKGLRTPYKSLLKLLLTQHYATQYPNIRPLCWDLKDKVHQGNTDFLNCDGYVLILNRVSQQIASEHDQKRLQLLRRAFYFKSNLPITKASQGQIRQWRYKELKLIVKNWGWSYTYLRHLDNKEEWQIHEVQAERNALVNEMLTSYRYIAAFSEKYAKNVDINRQDLTLLGNQLYAIYDAKPGKVLTINPSISPSLIQERLSLVYTNENRWQLIAGIYSKELDQRAIKQSNSLIELLCYAHFNDLLNSQTHFAIFPENISLSKYELRDLLRIVCNTAHPVHISSSNFLLPSVPVQWQLFINAGIDPMHHLTRKGLQKLSNRDDPLGFSALKQNLIISLDLLTINSWGEWRVRRFHGNESLVDCVQFLLKTMPLAKQHGWPELHSYCFCATQAGAIGLRVEQILADLTQHVLDYPKVDYILEIGKHHYIWRLGHLGIELLKSNSPKQLLDHLSLPRDYYVQYRLDNNALVFSPLRAIFDNPKPGYWQIYFWHKSGLYFWYLVDEHGVLLHRQQHANSDSEVLIPIIRFLRQVDQRMQRRLIRQHARPIQMYELQRYSLNSGFERKPKRLPPLQEQTSSIQLNAVLDDQNQITIYCNGEEFSIWEWGNQLYEKVAQTLWDMRTNKEHYPVYLTDLTLYGDESIIQHFKFKEVIEKDLNRALMALSTTR